MADTDKSLYNLRYNQLTSNLEAFGGGSPQWTLITLNNVDPSQVPVTRQINTTTPLQGGGNLTVDRTLSILQATNISDGYLSSVDWNTFNNKQVAGNYITALTGDGTATGPGSVPLTLATVNGNVGTFAVASITVNAKGLITSAAAGTTGSLTDVGTDGIVITNGTGAVIGTGTSIAQHVADTTHNGYLNSTDWNTFNSKQAAGNYITALTGDITAAGPGSVAATLATVNTNVGSFTNASITVNAKGLITAASSGTAPVTSVSGTAGDISSTGGTTPVLDLVNTAVTPATYTYATLTVDAKGRLTAASSGTAPVTSVSGTTNQITSTGGTTPVLALASPLTTPGAATISGNLSFDNPTTHGIVGTTSASGAAAGNVGEYLNAARQRGSELALTTATPANVTSISLTAGQWLVVATAGFDSDTTTSVSGLVWNLSTTSATLTNANTTMVTQDSTGQMRGEFDYSSNVIGNTSRVYPPLITVVNISSTTTYYLVAQVTFTVSTMNVFGSITATRMR